MMTLNPQTLKKLRRFKAIKRGYYSFLLIALILLFSVFAELLVNNRALIVSYEGELFFPTYTKFHPGSDFGESFAYEVNYRDIQAKWRAEDSANWLLMPLVPYSPYENDAKSGVFRPQAPSVASEHYLGTDSTSRDILARLFYGIRIALLFALAFMTVVYLIGITIGCAMGFFGGVF